MNKSAIITGASSGIGKALAFELARNGYDLFLTARNEDALQNVADECVKKIGVKVEIFTADLADSGATGVLIKAIAKRRFDVLVNNAGFGVKGNFAETNITEELEMLNVQLAAMLRLTKAVLPEMIEHKGGKILNIASVYSFSPVPMQAAYSASKAFMLSFSSALQDELKETNIQVSVVCPGITQTEFRTRAGIADKKNSGMTAEKVAAIAFAEMSKGKHVIVPGFQNKVFAFVSKHLPPSLITKFIRVINNIRGVNKKN
ncbi:MAG: SDR family oxidoreductase [Pyrinomonadaceae bacterium]|nr:SDR family oxidoreductase [Pyrinomonadaceae bacterium]